MNIDSRTTDRATMILSVMFPVISIPNTSARAVKPTKAISYQC